MTAYAIWTNGFRRARRTPALLLLLWTLTLAVAAVPAALMDDAIRAHLADSVEADTAADGVNWDWMQEFRSSGNQIGRTLRADVIGFAAVLDNASALADGAYRRIAVSAAAVFMLAVWFSSPGVIDRLAAGTPIGAARFLERCGAAAGPMLRLGIVAAIAYATLLTSLRPWLFDTLFNALIRNTTVERNAFFIRFALYALFFLVVAFFNLLFDVARTRLVVERRRSALGAITASFHFIADHFNAVAGQYALNVAAFVSVVAIYAVVAPGAGRADWTMWVGFAVSQAYICGRILVRLSFLGGTVSALDAAFGRPRALRLRDIGASRS